MLLFNKRKKRHFVPACFNHHNLYLLCIILKLKSMFEHANPRTTGPNRNILFVLVSPFIEEGL